jgi:hypothetical protein
MPTGFGRCDCDARPQILFRLDLCAKEDSAARFIPYKRSPDKI